MKKKEELEQHEKPLTVREKITIYMCFMIVKIVKPTNYSHEWSDIEDKVLNEVNK
jgi:hypothetical protein